MLYLYQLKAKLKYWVINYGIKLGIIDYLQLIPSGSKASSRNEVVSEISRALKLLAKELEIPLIALSQLSRSVESRGGDKRPQLSDLRDSGSIEQDADAVLFIYRPEYYGIPEDEEGNSTSGLTEVIFAKHRSGPLGTINLGYKKENFKFTNYQEAESTQFPFPSNANMPRNEGFNDEPF